MKRVTKGQSLLSGDEVKGRKQKMIYLFRTIGVFKGTQLVALQTAITLKENVRRKLWDQGQRTGMHLAAGCRMGSEALREKNVEMTSLLTTTVF